MRTNHIRINYRVDRYWMVWLLRYILWRGWGPSLKYLLCYQQMDQSWPSDFWFVLIRLTIILASGRISSRGKCMRCFSQRLLWLIHFNDFLAKTLLRQSSQKSSDGSVFNFLINPCLWTTASNTRSSHFFLCFDFLVTQSIKYVCYSLIVHVFLDYVSVFRTFHVITTSAQKFFALSSYHHLVCLYIVVIMYTACKSNIFSSWDLLEMKTVTMTPGTVLIGC